MSRRSRGTVVVLSILLGLTAAEVALNWLKGPEAQVEVQNLGDDPIESLVVTSGESRAVIPRVAPGASARVSLTGEGPRTLVLSFRQRGNPMTGFQHPGFDPAQMRRDGFKLVLRVRPNEVVRYQDDAEPATPMGRVAKRLWEKFLKGLGVEPDVKSQ